MIVVMKRYHSNHLAENLVAGRGGLLVMDNYVFTLQEHNGSDTLAETERITGTLKDIVTALWREGKNDEEYI